MKVQVDDIDGGAATQTVPFIVDGVAYEIDLSDDNATRLRGELARYIDVGRRTGGRKVRSTTPQTATPVTTVDRGRTWAIRTWARDNGWAISDRGRLPSDVIVAHDAAQQAPAATKKSRSRSARKK
ncbi:Lsr2 family protein [Saccharomonospora sp. NPDC046836]|uniref:histone-like nucleoid-structuring protein Lsr2 n=1 Tax=Saccharomonospora sp. NPDC046836 TaxID=3156921 RepID=UPI0033DA6262